MKTAIVCEGGAMRGVFTAGALQSFMDAGFAADMLVGVSAGASNGISYVSGQNLRAYRTNVDYAHNPRYAGLSSFLKTGSYFGMDFIFGEIADTLDPFDFAAFHASPCAYYAGATDVETGAAVFFGKDRIGPGLLALRASCSMPLLSPMVEIEGRRYLDGGVAAPIPLEEALRLGAEKLVVILTRPRGFTKSAQELKAFYRVKYRRFPAFVRTMDYRHLIYNRSLEALWRLEKEGKAVVVCPAAPLAVDRFGKDAEKLKAAYAAGAAQGKAALALI